MSPAIEETVNMSRALYIALGDQFLLVDPTLLKGNPCNILTDTRNRSLKTQDKHDNGSAQNTPFHPLFERRQASD
jgi:hypothetical protein